MNGVMSASVSPGSSQRVASVTCRPITSVSAGGAAATDRGTKSSSASRATASGRSRIRSLLLGSLLVEPDLLHAAVVVQRVVRDQVAHVRSLREVLVAPAQHRTRHVGLQLALDVPHELQPPGAVELARLRVDHPVHRLVAVVGVVAPGAALVVLEEVAVGVVDAGGGEVGADLVLAPGQ